MLILDKIRRHVNNTPDALVMISAEQSMTYAELWEKSGRLAAEIEKIQGSDKAPVMVFGHKDPLMLISFIACVRSGRAYCPVDVSTPVQRVSDIAEAIDKPLVLAVEQDHCLEGKAKIIERDEINQLVDGANLEIAEELEVSDEDTYYIIFTSGSTGKPKGVEISCGALSRFTDWSAGLGGSEEDKQGARFLNQAPFSFDLSVMDVYTALATGGCIFCLDKKLQLSMADMLAELGKSKVKYWISTPSFADMCLADRSFDENLIPELENFLFCGEKLTNRTAEKLMERFPKAKVINTYGPTESTVAVTDVEISKEMAASEKDLPIGRCKPGTEILIDENNGEIIIKGNTVSKGYFRDAEKTAKAFFVAEDGEPCYRTGDAGHFEGDMLYYGGRIDLQVKLHGYRIELGDIESNLVKMEEIESAVVVPKMQDGKVKYLQGYVVSHFDDKSNAQVKNIKAFLKQFLPEYMVPKRIIFIDNMPLTANGKADRKKLTDLMEGRS
ncbi:MAG: D-alanine--poly(phosphoribitol) ligase subunit DltA [[Eubacterium] sulci]|nr:D-alanine--poly(phosphoribitol) ligase subunit DltA [[Eubacterium] sulci]